MKRKIIWLSVSCLIVVALLLGSCAPAPPAEEEVSPAEEELVTEEEEEAAQEPAPATAPEGPPPSLTDATMAIMVHPSSNAPFPGKAASMFEDNAPKINFCAELVDALPNTEIKAEWIYVGGEHPDLQDSILYENSLIESENVLFSFSQDRPSSGWPLGDYEVRLYLNGELDKVVPFSIIEAPKLLIERLVGYRSGTSYRFEGRVKNVGMATLQGISIEISTYAGAPRGIPYEVQTVPLSPSTITVGEKASFSLKFQAPSGILTYSHKFLSPTGKEIPYTETEEPTALEELFYAAENGDKVRVEDILNVKGALLNAVSHEGERVLHTAVYDGQIEIAKFLIAIGADVNVTDNYNYTPLHLSIYRKLEETPEISQQKQEIAELLINKGADVNARTIDGMTPLYSAAYEGLVGIARLLIDNGADVNASDDYNYTPLHLAVYGGYKELVELLITSGANVDAKSKYGKYTPLHFTAGYGYTEIAKLLIANGANVNALDSDRHTPLHRAILYGHEETAEVLRQSGGYDK